MPPPPRQHAGSARVVVLQAAGPVFSSGHDLKELAASSTETRGAVFSRCNDLMLVGLKRVSGSNLVLLCSARGLIFWITLQLDFNSSYMRLFP